MSKISRRLPAAAALAALVWLAGCAGGRKIVQQDFAEGRIVDVSITDKLTGNRELLFFSLPKKTEFLEGYIQGVVTDYTDNPIQGVIVRAVASGESQADDAERSAGVAGTSFDAGVSDTNGFYKVRFSLPIIGGLVDVRGRMLYNPGWEQERENLGKAYEPQTKQSQFHFYYERAKGRIIFSEGIRKTVVLPVASNRPARAAAPPAVKTAEEPASAGPAAAATKPADKGSEDDLFKGFGFGQ
ncbi:MAG: hypothetical protein PHF00_03530 [Elusimicrobia bacterium]|nr:hypothetical protein [Elusimicrobiota bacterium]